MAWLDFPYQVYVEFDHYDTHSTTTPPKRVRTEFPWSLSRGTWSDDNFKLSKTQLQNLYATGELWRCSFDGNDPNRTSWMRIIPTKCFRATFEFKDLYGEYRDKTVPTFVRQGDDANAPYGWIMSGTDFEELLKSGNFAPVIDGWWTTYLSFGQIKLKLLAPYTKTNASIYQPQEHPIVL